MALALARESFTTCGLDAQALAKAHFAEVNEGQDPRRRFEMDLGQMLQLDKLGIARIYTARIDFKLVGYCTWNLGYDPESMGLLIAQQGAWYCQPGSPVGLKLFRFSISDLRSIGVKCVFPHHRFKGRAGTSNGKASPLYDWFSRLGAKPCQVTYSLWIGD